MTWWNFQYVSFHSPQTSNLEYKQIPGSGCTYVASTWNRIRKLTLWTFTTYIVGLGLLQNRVYQVRYIGFDLSNCDIKLESNSISFRTIRSNFTPRTRELPSCSCVWGLNCLINYLVTLLAGHLGAFKYPCVHTYVIRVGGWWIIKFWGECILLDWYWS